jgi:hypothetical protein
LSWWHTGRKFAVPLYATRDIYIKALRLLNLSEYKKRVRNLAVSVYDLIPSTDEQLELFASPAHAVAEAPGRWRLLRHLLPLSPAPAAWRLSQFAPRVTKSDDEPDLTCKI